jgi:hypothetical protein
MHQYITQTDTRYVIHIQGILDPAWAHWFDDLTITAGENGTTLLRGVVRDQTALYGIIGKLRDLGLAMISCIPETDV